MNRLITLLSLVILSLQAIAQNKDHIIWKFEAVKKTAGSYEIVATATVDKPWHIYSQNSGKEGPIPTSFSFKKNPLISLVGKVSEKGKAEKSYDDIFKCNVIYYNNTVVFTQNIKVKGNAKTTFNGAVEYMLCNDGQCTPPTKKTFEVKLP